MVEDAMPTTRVGPGEAHHFDPVGECIYCGAVEDLSDEHIIPYALGGNLVLPRSSCPRCSAMTSAFEGRVLRGFMHDARLAGGLPSRRKKAQPESIKVHLIGEEGVTSSHDVPKSEGPGFLILPKFAPPAAVERTPPTRGITIQGVDLLQFGDGDPKGLVQRAGATGIQARSQPEVEEFAQMLAKIAYSYVVAITGLFPRDETPLLDLMARRPESAGHWVGSREYRLAVEDELPLHALGLVPVECSGNQPGWLAWVKLFANTGAGGYEVAVRVPGWQGYDSPSS